MDHAAAGNLEPFLTHFPGERTTEVDLEAWFGIAEIVWAEPDARFRTHQFFEDKFHGAFQIRSGDLAIDI